MGACTRQLHTMYEFRCCSSWSALQGWISRCYRQAEAYRRVDNRSLHARLLHGCFFYPALVVLLRIIVFLGELAKQIAADRERNLGTCMGGGGVGTCASLRARERSFTVGHGRWSARSDLFCGLRQPRA